MIAARPLPSTWRAAIVFAAAIGVPMLLQSGVLGGAYVGPVALGFLPLPPMQHHLAILMAGFGLWLTHDDRMSRAPAPSRKTMITSAVLLMLASALAFAVTHPSPRQLAELRSLDPNAGLAWTAVVYACLLLPGAAAFGLAYPWSALRHCVKALAACALLGAGFVATGVASTVWHAPIAGPALDMAAWLLRLIDPAAVEVDSAGFIIAFRGFATRVGPQCAALDGVMLFLLLSFALWRYRSGGRPVRAALWACALAALLFLGNGVRIAGIMFIGSYDKTLGMDLFHGLAGTFMVLGMLWLFDRCIAKKPA